MERERNPDNKNLFALEPEPEEEEEEVDPPVMFCPNERVMTWTESVLLLSIVGTIGRIPSSLFCPF